VSAPQTRQGCFILGKIAKNQDFVGAGSPKFLLPGLRQKNMEKMAESLWWYGFYLEKS
jgi:hypothetical protein